MRRNNNIVQPNNGNILRNTQPLIQYDFHSTQGHPVSGRKYSRWMLWTSKQVLRRGVPTL